MTVVISKNPDLRFLLPVRGVMRRDVSLPVVIDPTGAFDWGANAYLTEYGGGPEQYGRRPLASSVTKLAYGLSLFCDFLFQEGLSAYDVTDSTLFSFVENLKTRSIRDETIISHVRVALRYLLFLQRFNPDIQLIAEACEMRGLHQVHFLRRRFHKNGRYIESINHRCLDGLVVLSVEVEFIRDHELEWWFDAVHQSTYHPQPTDFLVNRWLALGTLLDLSGSRISEAQEITRTMIKSAYKPNADPDAKAVIREVPVLKGKYKGRTRNVEASQECLQIVYAHVIEIERRFPSTDHDAIFVNADTGAALSGAYLKNYARKVINGSIYKSKLAHVCNHSFRHRFITLAVARELRALSSEGSFSNILEVAVTAVRKLTLHASNATLATYVHFAIELNRSNDLLNLPTPARLKIRSLKALAKSYREQGDESTFTAKALEVLDSL